jgi:hypothetical protein
MRPATGFDSRACNEVATIEWVFPGAAGGFLTEETCRVCRGSLVILRVRGACVECRCAACGVEQGIEAAAKLLP